LGFDLSERETETLNRARQLVFGNDSLAAVGAQLKYAYHIDRSKRELNLH
jgi:hypothetical protein